MFFLLFISDEKFSFLKEIVPQINTHIKRQVIDESKLKILNTFVFMPQKELWEAIVIALSVRPTSCLVHISFIL